MTNGEKYKTAQERAEAFSDWCIRHERLIGNTYEFAFSWLDLEAEEEKPLPCPFCGGEVSIYHHIEGTFYVRCGDGKNCDYHSPFRLHKEDAIAAHNRVAKKCMEVKE